MSFKHYTSTFPTYTVYSPITVDKCANFEQCCIMKAEVLPGRYKVQFPY